MIHETENAFKVVTRQDKVKGTIAVSSTKPSSLYFCYSHPKTKFHIRLCCTPLLNTTCNTQARHAAPTAWQLTLLELSCLSVAHCAGDTCRYLRRMVTCQFTFPAAQQHCNCTSQGIASQGIVVAHCTFFFLKALNRTVVRHSRTGDVHNIPVMFLASRHVNSPC